MAAWYVDRGLVIRIGLDYKMRFSGLYVACLIEICAGMLSAYVLIVNCYMH